MVSLLCFATSCYDYSKSLTKDKEMTSDLILETIKPGRTHGIKLKSGMEYKVRVKTIDRDSLSGYLEKPGGGFSLAFCKNQIFQL